MRDTRNRPVAAASADAARIVGSIGPAVPAFDVEMSAAEIESRIRWARNQGHMAYLWPDVPVNAWRACLREIERVTRVILSADVAADATMPTTHPDWPATTWPAHGVLGPPVDLVPPPGADAQAMGIAAFTSGMGPLLGWWCETGRLSAPPDLETLLGLHLTHGRERASRMARALADTLELLGTQGIAAVLIKSAHTGRTFFAEPALRPAADIDLVIEPGRMSQAERLLASAGYQLRKLKHRPRKSDWVPPGVSETLRSVLLSHGRNPFSIELHDSLDRNFYGVRTLRLARPGPDNTRSLPEIHELAYGLERPWLTALLAAHASEELHQLQLVRIVELVQVLRRHTTADWAALLGLIRQTEAARFVYPAFELAEQLVPGIVEAQARAEFADAATPRMRRVLERLGPATAMRLEGISLDERFLWARGPAETLRRLAHMLWPNRGENRSLGMIYGDRLRRLVRGRVRFRADATVGEASSL